MRGAEPGAGAQSSAGTPEPRTQSPKLRVQIPVQLPSLKTQGAQHPEPEPEPEPSAQDGRNRSAQQGAGFTESGYLSPGAAAGAADRLCQQVLPRCPLLGRGPELGPRGRRILAWNRSPEIKKHPTRALKIKRSLCQRPGICW